MKASKLPEINIGRTLAYILLLVAVTVAQFVFYYDVLLEAATELEGGDTPAPNAVWFIRFVSYLLPVLIFIFLQHLAYPPETVKKLGVATAHREMAIEAFSVILFIYAIMLPSVIIVSNSAEPEILSDGSVAKTLFEKTVMWFGYQAIPHLVVGIYHRMRYKSELEGESLGEDGVA